MVKSKPPIHHKIMAYWGLFYQATTVPAFFKIVTQFKPHSVKYYLHFIDDETDACCQNTLLDGLYQAWSSRLMEQNGENIKFNNQGMVYFHNTLLFLHQSRKSNHLPHLKGLYPILRFLLLCSNLSNCISSCIRMQNKIAGIQYIRSVVWQRSIYC